jgi:quinol monooxygenase YgiN
MKESDLMIIVRITMTVLPDKQKEVMQTLLSMIEPDGKEKGCLGHDLFCDIQDKQVFSLIEEWETREDMENHMQSDRFSALLGTKSLLAKPSDIRIHTVSQSEGMEAVKIARGRGSRQ